MVKFQTIDDYMQWLRMLSKDAYNDRRILPARATLRIVPLVAHAIEEETPHLHSRLFSIAFRASALALIAPLGGDRMEERFRAASIVGAEGTHMRTRSGTAMYVGRAVGYAAEYIDPRAILYAEYAIGRAAHADTRTRLPAHDRMWREISRDATILEEGGTLLATASMPLWSDRVPDDGMAMQWARLKQYLRERDKEAWTPVTDWYDARLRGDLIDTDFGRTETVLKPIEL